MDYLDWWKTLTTEQRYDFDSEGRGYKKDCGVMMQLAWAASAAAEREACARWLDDEADRQEAAWNAHLASGNTGPATSLHTIPRAYAARLRERSNV